MWAAVNTVLNALFDALFWPLHWLPAPWQMVVLALPAAIMALAIYKKFSNQAAIRDAKAKIIAHLLELRLFRDDLRVLLLAQGRVFGNIGRYIGHSLFPMLLMLIPFLLILVQIESRFAFRGLAPDEQAIITVSVASDQPVSRMPASLRTDKGLLVATPAMRADSRGEIYWRVHALEAGTYKLNLSVGDQRAQRALRADASSGTMTTSYRASDMRALLYPREMALPSQGSITALAIDYPRARGEFAGLSSMAWLFFGMVMFYGFALRRFFDVSF
jgi:hypothetical protein